MTFRRITASNSQLQRIPNTLIEMLRVENQSGWLRQRQCGDIGGKAEFII